MEKGKLFISVSVAALLSACGGGSQVPVVKQPPTQPDIPTTPNTNPDSFRTTEYNRNWALEAVNAANAYAGGYTGQGVKIGIVDFNFQLNSTEVNYSDASMGADQRWVEIYEAQIGDTATDTPHGHSVAVMAAGVKNNSGTHGLAYDAEVIAVDYFSGVGMTTTVQEGVTYHQANPYRYAVSQGAKVVNKSLGYDEDDIIENPPQVTERYVNAVDAYVVLDGGLLVSSAGNNGDAEPSLSNLDTIDILRDNNLLVGVPGALIIVGAVDQNNQIASFSDRAGSGESKNYYMVAPGVQVTSYWRTAADGEGLYQVSGTSFSAPLVSAAAALIWQRWPNLTAREVRQILFDTATDLGAPGVDAIYGHGLLNVDNALTAQGNVQIVTANGGYLSPLGASLSVPAAFGDMGAVMRAGGRQTGLNQALSSVTVFDKYGRDFQLDMTGGIRLQTSRYDFSHYLSARRDWQSQQLRLNHLGMALNYSVHRDNEPLAPLKRLGLFGEKARVEASQVEAKMDVTLPLTRGKPLFGSLSGDATLRLGVGNSVLSIMAADSQPDRINGLTGVRSLDYSFAGSLDRGFGLTGGTYAVLSVDNAQSGEKWSLGVGVDTNPSEVGYGKHPLSAPNHSQMTTVMVSRTAKGPKLSYSLQLGLVVERGSLYGHSSSGALALSDTAQTALVRGHIGGKITNDLTVSFTALAGYSHLSASKDSLFQQFDQAGVTSFSAVLEKAHIFGPKDSLSLTVVQPLRVEKAVAEITTGQGVDWDQGGLVRYRSGMISLAPSGREVTSEIAYRFNTQGFTGLIGAAYRHDMGHIRGVKDQSVYLSLSKKF